MSEESNDKKLHTRIFFALVSIFQKYGKVFLAFRCWNISLKHKPLIFLQSYVEKVFLNFSPLSTHTEIDKNIKAFFYSLSGCQMNN